MSTPTTDQGGELFASELQLSGTVIEQAQMRVRQADPEGHQVPVLVMDVETDGPLRNRCHIEQPFPAGQHDQCAAAARRYRRGTHITFQAPAAGACLVVPNVTHVHVHNPKE